MNGWFDNRGFNSFYLGKSTYVKKQQLLNGFYYQWAVLFSMGLEKTPGITGKMGSFWNASNKKKMKTRLLGLGYTSASVEGLFKAFAEWNKNAPK